MLDKKAPQLAGIDEAFADAYQKGFEIGTLRMGGTATDRTLGLPLLDQGPIEQGEEGTIVLHQRIMLQQMGQGGLVKEELLFRMACDTVSSAKELLLVERKGLFL